MDLDLAANALNIGLGVASTAVSAAAGYAARAVLSSRRQGHIREFLGSPPKLTVVLPSMALAAFHERSEAHGALIPENIPLMPMPEGRAVADLVNACLNASPKVDIDYSSDEQFVDLGRPVIAIGGPSVNVVSKMLMVKHFPEIGIRYPDHVGYAYDVELRPTLVERRLISDFGFVLKGRTRTGTPFLLFCGVWAMGTQLAARTWTRLPGRLSRLAVRRKFVLGRCSALILKTSVDGLRVGPPELVMLAVDGKTQRPRR